MPPQTQSNAIGCRRSRPVFESLRLCLSLLCFFQLASPGELPRLIDLEGLVHDRAGRALDRVTVVLTGSAGRSFSAQSDLTGRFQIPRLPSAFYRLTAARPGYLAVEREIDISAGRRLELTLLPVSEMTIRERVMVIGDARRTGDIPGSAQFIGAEELDRLKTDVDDIHQTLRRIPGINSQDEEGYGLRPNIGMRGSGLERNSKITVMEDGVLIAPAPYAAPAAYYFPSLGRMESVEVRKGSSQVKYGPRTNGGALNLVSTSIPADFGVSGNLALGEDDLRKLFVSAGDSYSNFGWMAQTYQLQTDGFKRLDSGGHTGFDLHDYLLKLRFNSAPETSVYQELEVKLGKTGQFGNETYLGLTDEDFRRDPLRRYVGSERDSIDTDHQQYQARYFIAPNQRFDFTAIVYRNDFARNWYKLQSVSGTSIGDLFEEPVGFAEELAIVKGDIDSGPDSLKVRANNREYYSYGFQSVAGLRLAAGETRHQFEFGLRYHRDEEDRLQFEDGFQIENGRMRQTSSGAPGSQANRLSQARAWAFFAQDEIQWRRLTVVPGIRYESIDVIRSDFSTSDPERSSGPTRVIANHIDVVIPGVGVHYQIAPRVGAFGGIHRGFSPPGPGSTELTEAEQSVNYEGGLRFAGASAKLELTGFFNDYDNLLGTDTLAGGGSGEGNLFNGGRARVYGLEASGRYDLGRALGSRFSIPLDVAYTQTRGNFLSSFSSDFEPWGDVQAGDEMPYIPRSQLFLGVGFGRPNWRVRSEAFYLERMRTRAGQGQIDPRRATDSSFTLAVTGEYDLKREDSNWTLFVSVRNLTDDEFIAARRPAGARPGLPRTLTAGLRFHFGR